MPPKARKAYPARAVLAEVKKQVLRTIEAALKLSFVLSPRIGARHFQVWVLEGWMLILYQ